ncbi:MAG: MAPEG family protein [Alphaproteobacteria bacterium]|nr:MAPEG family protein [Alphaproteobacteria bacterium]
MLTTTAPFIAFLLLIQVFLSIRTSATRAKLKIDYGDNDDLAMLKAIRAHGNFIEYVPMVLIAMGASELAGAPAWLLTASGSVLVVSRLSHAAHMSGYGGNASRIAGATLTTLVMLVLAVFLLGNAMGVLT